jgi:hypothetical protein
VAGDEEIYPEETDDRSLGADAEPTHAQVDG